MKKIVSAILLAAMVLAMIPAAFIGVFAAERTELDLKWNDGYIGCNTNAKKNMEVPGGGGGGWQYTDVFTVPKAGTKIVFDLEKSSYPTNAVYVFSSWKKDGDKWVIDLDGANVAGMASYEFIGQKNGHYEFVTDRDNQNIRLCTKKGTFKVYAEETTDKSTLQQLRDLEFTATFADNGKVEGIKWFCGYASSATNTNGSAKEAKYFSADYAVSNLIRVPKAGTKITYTISSNPNANYNAFTVYKLDGSHYTYDFGYAATDSLVRSGNTFTYITANDNEVIRLSCKPAVGYTTVFLDTAPVEVKWEATTEKPTAGTKQETVWPDPDLLSLVTGASLIGEKLDLKWETGYVGSQYQDNKSKRLTFVSQGASAVYYTSAVFTVPKAGTTIYFFDQNFTDHDGGKYSSTSALTVSHWKQIHGAWEFDSSKEYLTGCEVYQLDLTEKYRAYAYTTTEKNEKIRLCLRYAPMYSGEDAKIPPVYLVTPSDLSVKGNDNAGLTAGSYTDASGAKVEFSYYLPYGSGKAEKQYALVFDTSADSAVAKELASRRVKNAIVIAYPSEDMALAGRLLDNAVKVLPVKVRDLLFVGGDAIASHAAKFENIRLCKALLYTGSGKAPATSYAKVKALGDFENTAKAAEWVIDNYSNYYSLLEGLKLYAIGDSYFGGSGLGQHQTWVNLLGYKYGMNFHNYGIGGNQVALITKNPDSNSPSMCVRYEELPTDGDIYIIEGGRNDRHHSVPFGDPDSTDITTYSGALNKIISYITEKNPNAFIVLVTPWSHKSEGKGNYIGTNDDYADAMKKVAEKYKTDRIVCLYAADTEWTGINMSDADCRTKYCLNPNDVSHLNANGMYMVEPKFEQFIAEKYAKYKGIDLVDEAKDAEKFLKAAEPENPENPGSDETPAETTTGTPGTQGGESSSCSCASGMLTALAVAVCALVSLSVAVIKKVR